MTLENYFADLGRYSLARHQNTLNSNYRYLGEINVSRSSWLGTTLFGDYSVSDTVKNIAFVDELNAKLIVLYDARNFSPFEDALRTHSTSLLNRFRGELDALDEGFRKDLEDVGGGLVWRTFGGMYALTELAVDKMFEVASIARGTIQTVKTAWDTGLSTIGTLKSTGLFLSDRARQEDPLVVTLLKDLGDVALVFIDGVSEALKDVQDFNFRKVFDAFANALKTVDGLSGTASDALDLYNRSGDIQAILSLFEGRNSPGEMMQVLLAADRYEKLLKLDDGGGYTTLDSALDIVSVIAKAIEALQKWNQREIIRDVEINGEFHDVMDRFVDLSDQVLRNETFVIIEEIFDVFQKVSGVSPTANLILEALSAPLALFFEAQSVSLLTDIDEISDFYEELVPVYGRYVQQISSLVSRYESSLPHNWGENLHLYLDSNSRSPETFGSQYSERIEGGVHRDFVYAGAGDLPPEKSRVLM